MTSDKFRRQLRREAQLWQAEQLIDESLYQKLSDRYQFDRLETAASDRFVSILLGLGGILLGLGVITFVAANWQEWSRELKTILLLALFLIVNSIGFSLWRQPPAPPNTSSKKRKLGQGLLIFGALILGANIALMAQMFHISGSPYGLYLVWGLGVLAMAYGLQLTSLGFLAILLMAIGFWTGIPEAFYSEDLSWLDFIVQNMASVVGLLFIPLAYWCRSRVIFCMAVLALVPPLFVSCVELIYFDNYRALWVAIGIILPPALLWSYDDTLFPKIHSRLFQPLARTLAIWFFSILFFYLSFNQFWRFISPSTISSDGLPFTLLNVLEVLLFIGITLWQWFNLAKPSKINPRRWGLDSVSAVIGCFIVVTGGVMFWHLNIGIIPELGTFIINVEMFILAAGLIRIGLGRGNRSAFWGGLVLLTLQIMSRTFEYNTALLFKSLVFVLCGVGVIAAGLWFERHLSSVSLKTLEDNNEIS
ncbi:MAG: DUF2157 domain-containing protein [Cyanobacteriota bacterium]|nr:DUF2157 domain-containing protein [Cyanobacteriota bacterium]